MIKDHEMMICIIGYSCTGKTTLSKELSNKYGATLFRTDDYIPFGFKESIYYLSKDINQAKIKGERIIVEGVQIGRMLRRGLISPDLIIICNANRDTRVKRYIDRGNTFNDFLKRDSFDTTQRKIFNDYLPYNKARIFEYDTSNL